MKMSCIYKIQDLKERVYIGSAKDFKIRKSGHLYLLRKGKHSSKKLQYVFDKYGESSLTFEIVEFVEDTSELIKREQFYIDTIKPWFNISPTAGSPLGVKHSEATKKAHSERRKGKAIHDIEFKEKLSKRNAERVWSEESRLKNSTSKKGKKMPVEFAEKISKANKGRTFSDIHKKKIGESNKGRVISKEMRIAVANANKNRVWSEEGRSKIIASLTGRVCSEETRKKRSESMKLTIKRKKEEKLWQQEQF